PAIGFACDIDFLIAGIEQSALPKMNPIDVILFFDKEKEVDSLQLANLLRNKHYNVLTYHQSTNRNNIQKAQCMIEMQVENNVLTTENEQYTFTSNEEVITLLQQVRERE